MAATLIHPDPRDAAVWRAVAEGIVQRADAAMGERCGDALYPPVAAWKRTQGEPTALDWVDPARLALALGGEQAAQPLWLVHDAASGRLVLQSKPTGFRQSRIASSTICSSTTAEYE